ncbi:MAG TPA: hypothetical protein DDY70_06645 [Clostridiales bacterium]|nr:hypothetical protein [Clostridiales bacterium]
MMKKLTALAATLLLTLGVLLLCTSCGSVKELSVDKDHLPQTVFVEGNDLDLSAGQLLADDKTVSLTDPEVSVTGYDKNTVGKQTLTISYKGKETSLEVTVTPRFQPAESYLYFVGETIDAVSIRLRVTRDDGTNFSVSVGDEGVEVTGFSTDTATDALRLNVACRHDNTDYTGSFTVIVADPTVSFKKPRKSAYGSHELTLDVTGASLTLKNADGKVTRNISSDALTFTGYDPASVTAENPSATETVKAMWHGREMATFDVTVTYSDVSRVKDAAKTLSAIDWSHYEYPTDGKMYQPAGVTDADGKLAMSALELYYSLSAKDADFVMPAELDSIARLAIIYGYNEFYAAIKRAYADVFTLALDGGSVYLEYTCDTIDTARAGLAKLAAAEDDDTKLIFKYGNLLKNEKLSEKCGETVIYQGAEMNGQVVDLAVGHLMTIMYDSSFFLKIEHVLEKMIAIPDLLTVPAVWTADTLATYADSIEAVYTKFVEISLSDATDGGIYGIVNSWREGHDVFEILYRYYYGVSKDTDTDVSEAALKKINKMVDFYLPGPLEDLRTSVLSATLVQRYMASGAQQAQYGQFPALMESTMFFSYYQDATEQIAALIEEGDEMYIFLYANVFAQSVLSLQVGSYGYYALQSTSAFDDDCLAIMKQYLAVWEAYEEDPTYANTTDFSTKVDAMFRAFVALRPNQQKNVLATINYLYGSLDFMALYPSENGLYSEFASFIYANYVTALGIDLTAEEGDPKYDLFLDLMAALECYANGFYSNFGEFMSDAATVFATLSADDRTLFESKLGFLYTDMKDKFANFTKKTEGEGEEEKVTYEFNGVTLTDEWKAVFDEMNGELTRLSTAEQYIEGILAQLTGQSTPLYLSYLASFERVRLLENKILTEGDDTVLFYYYNQVAADGEFPSYKSVYDARGNYQRYLILLGVDVDTYEGFAALRTFLMNYADYFWTIGQLMNVMDPLASTSSFELTPASLKAMFAAFRALSADEKYMMLGIDSLNLYYGGLEAYFATVWQSNTNLSKLASALLAVEIAYITYDAYPDETYTYEDGSTMTTKELVVTSWDSFLLARRSLESDELTMFNEYFDDMYTYYYDVCEALAAEN